MRLGGSIVVEYMSEVRYEAAKQREAPANNQCTHNTSGFGHTAVIEANLEAKPMSILTERAHRRLSAQVGLIA